MTRPLVFWLLGVIAAVIGGCGMGPEGVNGSATVAAGQKAGAVSRVNGAIHVEEGATVDHANTVNGSIEFGPRSTGGGANTVNGGISLADGAKVSGSINTVNGSLKLANGAELAGNATNVNGDIRLDHAHIGGDIDTVNADIEIGTESVVDGGITMKKPSGISFGKDVPRIVIGPGATVKGTMKFERPVKLYVSDTATIGAVEGATPEKFAGVDAPK
jgi:cytoskeletal protein CcmA (bactofilin family)